MTRFCICWKVSQENLLVGLDVGSEKQKSEGFCLVQLEE